MEDSLRTCTGLQCSQRDGLQQATVSTAACRAEKEKGKAKGKLVGDGLPLLLSGDEFYGKVVEFTQWQQEEALKKAMKERENAELAGPIAEWKKQELARKADNGAKRQRYRDALLKGGSKKGRESTEKTMPCDQTKDGEARECRSEA
jgi:hypothetical protein